MQRRFVLLTALTLGACSNDSSVQDVDIASECSVAAQRLWLRDYMTEWYFWAGSSPDPDPDGFTTVQDYLQALLFSGDDTVPADRWSCSVNAASDDLFYEEEQALDYGLYVNDQSRAYRLSANTQIALELPLMVRFVEPHSPAAAAGLKRGDTIISLAGQPSADVIAANDFAALTPGRPGDTLEVVIDNGAGPVTYHLVAARYTVTPVPMATVLSSADGLRVGYLLVNAFTTPAEEAMTRALASIREQGATELIVDLRYNGGGHIDGAVLLASLIAGYGHAGEVIGQRTYNGMHQSTNGVFTLSALQTPAFTRVLVLTGPRSCSGSEMFVNGLAPFADVVTLGSSTCGKPVASYTEDHCGTRYYVANYELTNSLGAGKYYDGIPATCPIEDDFRGTFGSPSEKLVAGALDYLDNGGICPNPN